MFQFDVTKYTPRFLLNDKNGYAIAMAIQVAMQKMNDIVHDSVNQLHDVEKMPEWRLDEMAWELNCIYDFSASIDAKRKWIANAMPAYKLWGTKKGLMDYIGGYFDGVTIEESWEYDADPFHFRVIVDGEWNEEKEEWVRNAIDSAKNVRSVLDSFGQGSDVMLGINVDVTVDKYTADVRVGNHMVPGVWPEKAE